MSTVWFGGEEFDRETETVSLVNVEWPDFGPLVDLPNLKELSLTHTNPHVSPGGLPVDLAPLARLERLEVLILPHYRIVDLAPLAGLRALRVLDLTFGSVRDLRPLAELDGLRELVLRATRVADLTPVGELVGLETLDVAHTEVADLDPLRRLTSLRHLDVEGAPLSSEALTALKKALPDVVVTA